MIQEGIQAVVEGQDLSEADARAVMTEIMDGEATPAQIAAFLVCPFFAPPLPPPASTGGRGVLAALAASPARRGTA
jgi:hypothetical protein